jgi:hypothetical protein
LLPSQAHTVFQLWPAAITPAIAVEGGGKARVGGSVLVETGMPKAGGGVGDLMVTVDVVVPQSLTDEQRQAVEALAAADSDNPRAHLGV